MSGSLQNGHSSLCSKKRPLQPENNAMSVPGSKRSRSADTAITARGGLDDDVASSNTAGIISHAGLSTANIARFPLSDDQQHEEEVLHATQSYNEETPLLAPPRRGSRALDSTQPGQLVIMADARQEPVRLKKDPPLQLLRQQSSVSSWASDEQEEKEASSTWERISGHVRILQLLIPLAVFITVISSSQWTNKSTTPAGANDAVPETRPLTLRDVLTDEDTGFHLAMAPAFFGFYGYFGALAAWYDLSDDRRLPIKSAAGASAGAMAAILLAAGIPPDVAAAFCAQMTVGNFADPPGLLALFRGNKFERIMDDFLESSSTIPTNLMQDSLLPVAVTAFDLQTMQGKILETGSMARAARASATFPGLFQPVGWNDGTNDYVFIDGGIADPAGMLGLTRTMEFSLSSKSGSGKGSGERVICLCVGSFMSTPPGPSFLPGNPEVISVSLQGLPQPGPWAMKNGPRAFEAAREAMKLALDVPLERVSQRRRSFETEVHYELAIPASPLA